MPHSNDSIATPEMITHINNVLNSDIVLPKNDTILGSLDSAERKLRVSEIDPQNVTSSLACLSVCALSVPVTVMYLLKYSPTDAYLKNPNYQWAIERAFNQLNRLD
jgi:hypothetical protein